MPGIPPNTVDNVKRLLKGIFRRGKNKKQKSTSTTEQTPASQPTASAPAHSSTANGAAPAVDKPLPPTHPLEAGRHDKPQEAESKSAASTTPARATPEEQPPAPPPKNDGAFDSPKLDTSENKENVRASSNVPPSDSAIATPNTPAKATEAIDNTKPELPSHTPAIATQNVKAVEEKVPLHAEAAVPKTSATANGMSATSGPLEDFPAGIAGDKE